MTSAHAAFQTSETSKPQQAVAPMGARKRPERFELSVLIGDKRTSTSHRARSAHTGCVLSERLGSGWVALSPVKQPPCQTGNP